MLLNEASQVHKSPQVCVGRKDRKMKPSVKYHRENFTGWVVKKFAIASNNSLDSEKIPVTASKLQFSNLIIYQFNFINKITKYAGRSEQSSDGVGR